MLHNAVSSCTVCANWETATLPSNRNVKINVQTAAATSGPGRTSDKRDAFQKSCFALGNITENYGISYTFGGKLCAKYLSSSMFNHWAHTPLLFKAFSFASSPCHGVFGLLFCASVIGFLSCFFSDRSICTHRRVPCVGLALISTNL